MISRRLAGVVLESETTEIQSCSKILIQIPLKFDLACFWGLN
jgi:hypothetical protein